MPEKKLQAPHKHMQIICKVTATTKASQPFHPGELDLRAPQDTEGACRQHLGLFVVCFPDSVAERGLCQMLSLPPWTAHLHFPSDREGTPSLTRAESFTAIRATSPLPQLPRSPLYNSVQRRAMCEGDLTCSRAFNFPNSLERLFSHFMGERTGLRVAQ